MIALKNAAPFVNSIQISGKSSITVPRLITMTSYKAKVLDQYGKTMLFKPVTWSIVDNHVSGVTIGYLTGILTVTRSAKPGTTFTIRAKYNPTGIYGDYTVTIVK